MKSSLKRSSKWHWLTLTLLTVSIISFVSGRRSEAQSGTTYTITDLGPVGNLSNPSYGINNLGDIVGTYLPAGSSFNHPFFRKHGTSTNVDLTPGANGTGNAYVVNSSHSVVGYSESGVQRAFIWVDGDNDGELDPGEFTFISPSNLAAVAFGLNDSGHAVGVIDDGSGTGGVAFEWDSVSGVQNLSGSAGINPFFGFAINNAGNVVGSSAQGHAFARISGNYVDLGTLGDSSLRSVARSISEDNYVVGHSQTPSNDIGKYHAFIWRDANGNHLSDSGEMKDLIANAPGYAASEAYDINASNEIVGTGELTASGVSHAVLWHDDDCNGQYGASETYDLNNLVAEPNWALQNAQSINDSGQIVGFGTLSGVPHAFLLTPSSPPPGACGTPTPTPSPTPTPATTTISSVSGSGTYGTTATLTATLTSNSTPISGKTISFTVNGSAVCGGVGQPGCPTTNLSGIATLSVSGYNAGSYPIVASFAGDSSYANSNGNGTLTISQATPTITWNNPADIVYGTPLSGTQLNATASVPGTFTYTPAATTVLHVGNGQTLHVDFTPTDTANNTGAAKNVLINVLKAPLTITADNKVKLVGDPNPTLTFTPTGFVNGDTASILGGTPSLTTTATQSSPTGTYPIAITQATLAAADYAFTFVNGTLTVTEAAPVLFIETGTEAAPVVAAVDSVTFVRGPFRVTDSFNFSSDHLTRIIIFTSPLGLTSPDPQQLKVKASGIDLTNGIEAVGNVTGVNGLNASYIVVKLDPVLTGSGPINYDLTVSLRGVTSNTATLTIIP